jgi:hypothetical protein
MKTLSRRLRTSTLTTGLSLLVFASSALLAGCSGSSEPTESVAAQSAALLTIPAPDPDINLQFGTAIAADDQTLIIGDAHAKAPAAITGMLMNRGEVHVYTRAGGVEDWQSLQVLKPFGPVKGEVHFGQRLALSGNTLIVSASRDALDCGTYPCANIANDDQQGAFYVYKRTGPGQPFTRVGTKYTDPSPVREARFGLLVATNGQYIAAAAGTGDGGTGEELRIFTIQANGTITYSYSISPAPKPIDIAMTPSGILAVVPGNAAPEIRTYQLQAAQAVAVPNSAAFGSGYRAVVAHGNTIAALDSSNGGRVVMAPVSAAGVGTVTTIPALGLGNAVSLSLLENQRIIVGDNDLNRPKLAKYELVGGTWTDQGFIYSPLSLRVSQAPGFATGLAATSEFVAAGDMQRVLVSDLDTIGRLDGATFEKQRVAPTDACGSSCGTQSFGSAEFGRQSAISGDVAVLTQPDSNSTTRTPSAHIYTRTSGVWGHTAQFNYAGKRTRDVAVDSNRVYVGVGTPGGAPSTFVDGSVLVYERNASQVWQLAATLTPSDPTSFAGKMVGDFIAASGDIVVAGTYQFVYIFQRSSGGTWSQIQKLPVTPLSAQLGQPHTVALSDTYLVVGAPYDTSTDTNHGSVFVYRRSDWGLEQKFGPQSSSDPSRHYGYSVAVDGTTILVGAPDGGSSGGYVDVRERTGTGTDLWKSKIWLKPYSGQGFNFRLGTSVSLVGDRALVGAVGDPLTHAGGGAAYLFPRVNGVWDQMKGHVLLPSDFNASDQASFGWGVQLSGTSALITAPPTAGSSGAGYFYEGLVDADNDGLLAANDCNDSDGLGISCVLGAANLSFEPTPRPQWTADTGSFTLSTTHTDGTTAAKLGSGVAKLSGPLFSTTLLREVGTALSIDIQRPTSGSNAVTLFYSAPALNVSEAVIGTIDLSSFPTGAWKTASLTIPTALRNILLGQSTNVRFHLQFNVAAQNLLIDNLRFTGKFDPRLPAPPASNVSATLTTTSSASNNYCMALRLGNSGASPTTTWSVVINTQGTTITSNWNAAFSGTSGTVTLTNNQAFNASIPAGATAFDPSVGFCANRTAGSSAIATVVSASGQ